MVPPERNMTPKLQVRSRQGRVPSCFHDDQGCQSNPARCRFGLVALPFPDRVPQKQRLCSCHVWQSWSACRYVQFQHPIIGYHYCTRLEDVEGITVTAFSVDQFVCNVLSRGEFITATPSQFGWPFIFWAFAAAGAMGKGMQL